MPRYTSQRAVCAAFWREHRGLTRVWVNGADGKPCRPQNLQPTDTRVAFVEFVDNLARNGDVTENLASIVTLN